MKNPRLLLLGLAATSLIAAGCGSSDNSSSTSTSTPAASTSTPAASTPAASTPASTPPTASTPTTADAAIQAAVDACGKSIDAQPTLKDDVKADLKKLCQKAASGNAEDVKKATKEVCTKIIQSSVPAGAARDQALAACDQATG